MGTGRAQSVGVLTFHRCINYGSYWQARCLVEGLRALGAHASLLDHHSPQVNRAEWKCALRPTLPERTSRADYPRYAAKARKFFDAFRELPMSEPFSLEDAGGMAAVDLVVVGSDEVWNFSHPWYASYPLFFGEGLRTDRVVSYAASFGNHDAGHLSHEWANRLRRFSSIGVRDAHSQRIVRETLGLDPALVLDPCLQFDAVCRRAPSGSQGDVIVYGHGFPDWFARHVRAWASAAGARLVSIGYRNDWADEQWLEAGPEEFAQAMADARGVVTNFFHGCVFALVNQKPLICTPSQYRFNKVTALVQALGAEDHLVAEGHDLDRYTSLLEAPLDPGIPDRIETLRRHSGAYLDNALAA